MTNNTFPQTPVWSFFHQITQIPRPSKKEGQIMQFLEDFALTRGLKSQRDQAGNLLICKQASPGHENRPTIILQAHTDMVCEKNKDTEFDFDTQAIQTYIDGDWVKARGTTLGADNGIGMAMMLAILDTKEMAHPSLECLFTVDEETGLTGAFALDHALLKGDILINLDSEDDGQIFVGCAGGIDTTASLAFETETTPANSFAFTVSVKGLIGGHSGDDIHKRRGNANKILTRFLWLVNKEMDLRLSHIQGGNLRNAIPREASALCTIPWAQKERVRILFNHFVATLEEELHTFEPGLHLDLESEETPLTTIDKLSSDKLLNALYACPHGVITMSQDMPNLVETSTNLASIKLQDNNTLLITTSQRSSIESAKYDIAQQVEATFLLTGAQVSHGDGYPGWQPNLSSNILKIAQQAYLKLFNQMPTVRAIHAGLECGLFLKKYPHLDMISIGPQMHGVHSPDERLSISSTQKCWEWLGTILATH